MRKYERDLTSPLLTVRPLFPNGILIVLDLNKLIGAVLFRILLHAPEKKKLVSFRLLEITRTIIRRAVEGARQKEDDNTSG